MAELLVRFVTGAIIAAVADALIPEGGIKSSANKLIALAIMASVLIPLLEIIAGK